MAKSEKFIVTTPIVELGYGYLRTPDTKFDTDGHYKLDFFMSPAQAKAFVANIESDPRAVVKGKKAKVKFTKVDGTMKFRTKQAAVVKSKSGEVFNIKPRLYYIVDGQTVPYPEDAPLPFSGTTAEIEVEVVPFEGFGGGLTLRLRAVRLHKIVTATPKASGDWAEVDEDYGSDTEVRDFQKDALKGSDDSDSFEDDDEGIEDDDDARW